jgi:hypothetical protein
LTAERRHVEVAPGGSHHLVAAAVDEVCAEHPLAVAEEHIVAVPFINSEVRVEAVGGPATKFLFDWNPESVRPPIFPARVESLASVAGAAER